jgi:hypothetical protein
MAHQSPNNTKMVPGQGEIDWRLLVVIQCIHIGAFFKECLHDISISHISRRVQSRVPRFIPDVNINPGTHPLPVMKEYANYADIPGIDPEPKGMAKIQGLSLIVPRI